MNHERTEAAVAALRAGRGVVVADHGDREDEGDLVLPGSLVTEQQIAFMMTNCRGLICTPMTGGDLDRLRLPDMTERNDESHRTAFTVSVDSRHGITTGISAADRARTIRLLADPRASADAFVRPGHVFPLRAAPDGVLGRPGHTEAGVDLLRLAGLPPVAVICEIADRHGRMVRGPRLRRFARRHDLPFLTIDELIDYLKNRSSPGTHPT